MEGYKDFTSLNNEISLVYPDFLKYKYENNNTYLFYDEYAGSFRITIEKTDSSSFSLANFLKIEFQKNIHNHAKFKKFNSLDFVCYEVDSINPDEHVTHLHYYVSGSKNFVLICSYAYDKSLLDDEFSRDEIEDGIEDAEQILASIIIN